MLDIHALQLQLERMGDALRHQATLSGDRIDAADRLYGEAVADEAGLLARLAELDALGQLPGRLACPTEPLGTVGSLPVTPTPSTVVATDGSQIEPSHHEIARCFVLNVGRILYSYGTGEVPIQDSRPTLQGTEGDERPLIGGKPVSITPALVGALRDLAERQALVELAALAVDRGHPAVALVDGPLGLWPLDGHGAEVQGELQRQHVACLDACRDLGVPVAGYVSASRSTEVTAMLRLVAGPGLAAIGDRGRKDAPPCGQAHRPLSDRTLWERRLAPGERSPIFKGLPEARVPLALRFFYLHVGAEVARIEVPEWVAASPDWLDRLHALAYDQAQKGRGYPIALQEAHHQAVITREDRDRFLAVLSRHLQQRGVKASLSPKQKQKRTGIA